jgi:hypothetical protein
MLNCNYVEFPILGTPILKRGASAFGSHMSYKIPRPYQTLGQYLREARLSAGLTQKEVSDKLQYSSAQFISNAERGILILPPKKLRRVIKMYKISVDEVIEKISQDHRAVWVASLKGEKGERGNSPAT